MQTQKKKSKRMHFKLCLVHWNKSFDVFLSQKIWHHELWTWISWLFKKYLHNKNSNLYIVVHWSMQNGCKSAFQTKCTLFILFPVVISITHWYVICPVTWAWIPTLDRRCFILSVLFCFSLSSCSFKKKKFYSKPCNKCFYWLKLRSSPQDYQLL